MNPKRKSKKNKLEKEVDLHEVGAFVHGALFSLHALGAFYNLRKKRYLDAGIHAAIGIYDLVAAKRHYETSKNEQERTYRTPKKGKYSNNI